MEEQDEVPRGQKNRVPEELWSLYPQRIEEIIALEDTEEIPLEWTQVLLSWGLKKNKN